MRDLRCALWLSTILLVGCTRSHNAALVQAATDGDILTLQALLANGENPNQKDARGLTGLIMSARAGGVPAVQILLKHGADPNLRGGVNDWTPLMHAIHKNQRATAQALLDGGAEVDGRGRNGETALMMAAGYGYTPIVELLLDRGANPRAKTKDGADVFTIAASGVPDIDHFTLGACQASTIQALKRKDPSLHLSDNIWGKAAKLALVTAKLRGCSY
jgi:hypothetical protein